MKLKKKLNEQGYLDLKDSKKFLGVSKSTLKRLCRMCDIVYGDIFYAKDLLNLKEVVLLFYFLGKITSFPERGAVYASE